ncbi:type IV pilin protein [Pseudoduganella lutea]|uniref:Prepilin-type N-terminal cleavage/methylation domain-containing protein n=1 Tax=Pseudoduganella lutea TaxID=321985 RepID=A0A4P6KTE5_9BURK|nr:type IV pilin protein [Pseudoduganella lutea]QBE62389.1 prepilin-type N-terminal cleavage/methylation domain-containing protein [Pseudoduganella lutea]
MTGHAGKAGGFTLVELMVVVAVAGVLAATAYPGYRQHVIRAKRTEGQVALQALMQQQERYFTQNNRYIAFDAASNSDEARLFRWWSGASAATSAYEIEGRACDGEAIADCVQLIATPGTARVDGRHRDPSCDRLILTSTGLHLASGPAIRCWQ